jgi:hypothetical protein
LGKWAVVKVNKNACRRHKKMAARFVEAAMLMGRGIR